MAERRPLEGATVSPRLHELPAIQALAAQLSDGIDWGFFSFFLVFFSFFVFF